MARFVRLLRRLLYLFAGLALLGVIALGILYWLIAPRLPDVQELRNVQLQVPLSIYTRDGRLVALIDETRRLHPESSRAGRRVDAERCLRRWGRQTGVAVSILRAPGIYAADRLPLARLEKGMPALVEADDAFTNHIHADDLASACLAALRHGGANRAYNVVDDSDLRMAEYFDRVADAFALPRPPRISRLEAEKTLSPVQMSFMRESRRIGNERIKKELRLRLAYPTVDDGIAEALRRIACLS